MANLNDIDTKQAQVIEVEPGHLAIEAELLDWPMGYWPKAVKVDGVIYGLRRLTHTFGEYRTIGGRKLTVWNM